VPDVRGLTSSCFLSVLVLVPRVFRFARDDFRMVIQRLDAHEQNTRAFDVCRPRGMRLGCVALRFHT